MKKINKLLTIVLIVRLFNYIFIILISLVSSGNLESDININIKDKDNETKENNCNNEIKIVNEFNIDMKRNFMNAVNNGVVKNISNPIQYTCKYLINFLTKFSFYPFGE